MKFHVKNKFIFKIMKFNINETRIIMKFVDIIFTSIVIDF